MAIVSFGWGRKLQRLGALEKLLGLWRNVWKKVIFLPLVSASDIISGDIKSI